MKHSKLFLTGLGTMAAAVSLGQTTERPNVILLVADDLGYGDLSCYGAQRVSTPVIDSIARSGVRFTDCHAVASTSTPSRYSLLTGEYCFRRVDTGIAAGNAKMIIRPEQYTVADMFKSQGYATAAIGKWHLGLGSATAEQTWNAGLDVGVNDLGFDYSYIMAATADRVPCVFIEDGRIANYDPEAPVSVSYVRNFEGQPTGRENPELLTKLHSSHGHDNSIVNGIGRIGFMKGGGKALWRDEDIADSIMAHAIAFVEKHKSEPFFMYLGTNDVHVPRYPHERFRGKSPMGLRGEAILQFDYSVGLLCEALRRNGLDRNTLLIITSDNGPVLDDGYQDRAVELAGSHKPGGDFRGAKYSTLEAGTAVPFIVSWPAQVEPGIVSHALASHIDLAASMASLIGADMPASAAADSRDALSTWLGRDQRNREYAIGMAANRSLTLRRDNWKYIEACNGGPILSGPGTETGFLNTPQLYDLATDIHEDRNLSAEQTTVAAEMSQLLTKARLPYVSDDATYWYSIYTPRFEKLALTADGNAVKLATARVETEFAQQWKFVGRNDGSFDIVSRADGRYLCAAPEAAASSSLSLSDSRPAQGWRIDASSYTNSLYVLTQAGMALQIAAEAGAPQIEVVASKDSPTRFAAQLCDIVR